MELARQGRQNHQSLTLVKGIHAAMPQLQETVSRIEICQAATSQDMHLYSRWIQHQANFDPGYGLGHHRRHHHHHGIRPPGSSPSSPSSSNQNSATHYSPQSSAASPPPPPPPPPPRRLLANKHYATAEAVYDDYHGRFLSMVMGDSWASCHGYSAIDAKNIRRLGRLVHFVQGRQNRLAPIVQTRAQIEERLAACSEVMKTRQIHSPSGIEKMIQRMLKQEASSAAVEN